MTYLETKVTPKEIIGDSVKKILQNTVILGNIILGIFGILILLYSAWMFFFCFRNYQEFIFSAWFLWACFGTGIVFIIMAILGHTAASSRRRYVLSYYVTFKAVLLFFESLITADVCLNDHWQKDFPDDPTQRFENFIIYARSHSKTFNLLAATLLLSQAIAFLMAVFLRTMFARLQLQANIVDTPLLNNDHIVTLSYIVVGYPYPKSKDTKDTKEKNDQEGYLPLTNVNVD